MFQIDEKIIADNRTMLTIQSTKSAINSIIKNGTINYTKDDSNLWLTNPKVRQAYINKDPKILDMYDRIIMARNGSNVDGSFVFDDNQKFGKDVEIGKNLLVRGNLTVTGDSTTIDTPKLTVEDNIIELNRNEKNAGITLVNSGMAFNRGTKPFARYLYNELEKSFVLDTSTNMDGDVTTESWVLKAHSENSGSFITGEVRVKSKLTVPVGNITGTLSVAQGTTTNTLLVNSTSAHTGASTFGSTVAITDSLTVTGKTYLNNTLNVKNTSNFEANVTMKQNLLVERIGTFKERSIFEKGLVINTLGADITGPVNIIGNTAITGTLSTTENVSFAKDLTVGEATNTKNLNVTLTTTTKDLSVSNDLAVKRNTAIDGELIVGSKLSVNAEQVTLGKSEFLGNVYLSGTDLFVNSFKNGSGGNVTIQGDISIRKTLTVTGNSTLTGNVTNNGDLIANNLTTRNNITVHAGNGKGIRFNNEDTYKVYVSDQADSTWGRAISSNSNGFKNMYFSMPTNKTGFVFKANSIALAEINALGQIHSIEHMFAKNSQVLRHADMGHAPANNTAINACMVDGKHSTDLLLRDGTQTMLGDLKMNGNKINFANDDCISYNDSAFNLGGSDFAGKYSFTSDNNATKSILEAGAFNAGVSVLKEYQLKNVDMLLDSSNRFMIHSNSNTLVIGGGHIGDPFTEVSFGQVPTVQVNNTFKVGSRFVCTPTTFKIDGFDILTTNGHATMLGDINMNRSKITFNAGSNTGTTGAANSDYAEIFAEHDNNAEVTRMVLCVKDNVDDSIVLRTSTSSSATKESLIVNNSRATFFDNPYFGNNRLIHSGDIGSGNEFDADKLDGKHYSDLVSQFIDAAGDTMTGQLTMAGKLKLNAAAAEIIGNSNKVILKDHYNGNVTLSATGGDLYIGYSSDTTKVRLEKEMICNGKTIIASNGTVPYSVLSGVPKFVSNVGNGSATTFTIAHGLGIADLVITVKEVATNEIVYPDVKCDGTNIIITFGIAPTSNQYRVIAIG